MYTFPQRGRGRSSDKYKQFICPVCKTRLGGGELDHPIKLHCEECKTMYTFYPGILLPTAKLDRSICNCVNCRDKID